MNRARQVVLGELALLADVDEQKFLPAIELLLHLIDRRFLYARLRVFHNLQKPWRVFHISPNTWAAKVHSSGALSSRIPINTGARSLRPPSPVSCVHSENFISATRSGRVQ